MNVILPITITFTLLLVHGSPEKVAYNQHPCERNYNNNAYNKFVWKHILRDTFDRSSKSEWKQYLQRKKLCDRHRQSFFRKTDEENVKMICNGRGINKEGGNLCTSATEMWVYYLEVNTWTCEIQHLNEGWTYVVVGCDKVDNLCLPVHFEKSTDQRPDGGTYCRPDIVF